MDSAQETIRKYEAKIRMVAKGYCRAGIEEDDLLQEGRIAMLKAFNRFDSSRGTLFWTFAERFVARAMRDLVARESRQIRGERVDERAIEVASNTTPHDALVSKERKRLLVVAIMELSEEERDLLARRFDDEHDFRTIAMDLGVSTGKVHAAVRAAIESLIAKAKAA